MDQFTEEFNDSEPNFCPFFYYDLFAVRFLHAKAPLLLGSFLDTFITIMARQWWVIWDLLPSISGVAHAGMIGTITSLLHFLVLISSKGARSTTLPSRSLLICTATNK